MAVTHEVKRLMTARPNPPDDSPEMLSEGLLEALAERWRSQRMSIIDALRPGLSDAAMDELTRPLGLKLPHEARVWWGWHDGADAGSPFTSYLGPLRVFSPLAAAVRATAQTRETMQDSAGDLDEEWRASWLMLGAGGETTVIDCAVSDDAPVPTRYYRFDDPAAGNGGVPSLGTLVRLYIDAFDRGAWSYDPIGKVWSGDPTKNNPATAHLHLT
jgi:hypothetical protein